MNKLIWTPDGKVLHLDNLKEEVETNLRWLAEFGKQPSGGVTRLLYSDDWREAQHALHSRMVQMGLSACFDEVGNLFGTLEGTDQERKPIWTGSHIDTVKDGGMYDGAFGIVAGIVALKVLKEQFGRPKRSLTVVSLCEEEGSRFPLAYWGSGSITGHRHFGQTADLADEQGVPFRKAMEEAGFGPGTHRNSRCGHIGAFLELHVEQGVVLERTNNTIGVVEAIVGQRRYTIEVTGEANHAGTTPMAWRKDALNGANHMINYLYDAARKQGAPLVATVGRVEVVPNVVNVIPGKVTFTVDVRHPDAGVLDSFCEHLIAEFDRIAEKHELHVKAELWMNAAPVALDKGLGGRIERICQFRDIPFVRMVSGAGHDVQMFQPHCPSALIFVPSHQGISHSPQEYTSSMDLATGVGVLIELLYSLGYQEETDDV